MHFNFNQICCFDPLGGAYSFNTDRSIQQGDALFCHQNPSTGQFSCPTFNASRVTCPTAQNLEDCSEGEGAASRGVRHEFPPGRGAAPSRPDPTAFRSDPDAPASAI